MIGKPLLNPVIWQLQGIGDRGSENEAPDRAAAQERGQGYAMRGVGAVQGDQAARQTARTLRACNSTAESDYHQDRDRSSSV